MNAFNAIRDYVKQNQELQFNLKMGHTVRFSTLTGSIPIYDRIQGWILDYPVDIRLKNMEIFKSPVNTEASGRIGDSAFHAKLNYKVQFSTLAGNIPINDRVRVETGGKQYTLRIPATRAIGSARRGQGGAAKSKKVHGGGAVKFRGGHMVEPGSDDNGGGPAQSVPLPVPRGLYGTIEDIELDIRITYSYYINTSSGRTPMGVRAIGVLRAI